MPHPGRAKQKEHPALRQDAPEIFSEEFRYLLLYIFSKKPSSFEFLSQVRSTTRSALIDATLGFCSATYLMTVRVPSTVG